MTQLTKSEHMFGVLQVSTGRWNARSVRNAEQGEPREGRCRGEPQGRAGPAPDRASQPHHRHHHVPGLAVLHRHLGEGRSHQSLEVTVLSFAHFQFWFPKKVPMSNGWIFMLI
jgi:hypothetical protein